MITLKEKLLELEACDNAVKWAGDKTIEEFWETCHRGDWMLWLFIRTNPEDIKLLHLASGHYSNTFRHLMKDERSKAGVDACIAFGNGEITKEELDKAIDAARKVFASADFGVATYAARLDSVSAYTYTYTSPSTSAATYAETQLLTANICRKYLPVPKLS
jgi:hypothetical protein